METEENPKYLTSQLLTYIGNKRKLLDFIETAVIEAKQSIGQERVTILDAFSGSGVVSRMLKKHSKKLIANDLELYCQIINECYLANKSEVDMREIEDAIRFLNDTAGIAGASNGIIRKLYSPADDQNIQDGERAFYTNKNADIIDYMRQAIMQFKPHVQKFCLAPLFHEASVHANTSGVFKGFYKNKEGIGQFGGSAKNCLDRITKDIELDVPILSNFECEWEVHKKDANQLVKEVEADIAYFDPPYNQHPYGSNYFMLNVIAEYVEPTETSKVSGIPVDWNKSAYNKRGEVINAFEHLIKETQSKFILISYNNEGFASVQDLVDISNKHGTLVEVKKKEYPTFRGSRNLKERTKSVDELLFVVKK